MSSLPQKELEAVTGPNDDLVRILAEKVAKAEQFLRDARPLLNTLLTGSGRPSAAPNRYANLAPWPAMVVMFQEQKRAMTEQEIVEELVDGQVMTGAKQQTNKARAENVKRAIKANVNNGNLRSMKVAGVEKYGLKDWEDSFFK
jgi:hypothetical protein